MKSVALFGTVVKDCTDQRNESYYQAPLEFVLTLTYRIEIDYKKSR
jgi:hypothetical protein